MLRICFVALNAYPAIDPTIPGGIGGIQTRAWMFARGLAARPDCEVTFVVRHTQPLRQSHYSGVRLHLLLDRWYATRESLALRLQRRSQFPFFSITEPRWSDAISLPVLAARKALIGRQSPQQPDSFFTAIDADLFVTFGVQSHSATVIASAHTSSRPAVLFLGSDGDLDERYLSPEHFISAYGDSAADCRWTIDQADQILCQTPSQEARLELFGRTAMVVPNPIDLDEWDALSQRPAPLSLTDGLERYVLWIGRAENVHKRPIDCVEVARRCPDIPFLMILNHRDDAVEAEVKRTAPANLHIIERVSFPEMPGIMRRAAVLVNTSSLEGFPNTYLQAAATGVPVASLNVEREFLEKSGAGVWSGGAIETLAEQVQSLWQGARTPDESGRARQYIERHHSLAAQLDLLARSLREVFKRGRQTHAGSDEQPV